MKIYGNSQIDQYLDSLQAVAETNISDGLGTYEAILYTKTTQYHLVIETMRGSDDIAEITEISDEKAEELVRAALVTAGLLV